MYLEMTLCTQKQEIYLPLYINTKTRNIYILYVCRVGGGGGKEEEEWREEEG